MQASNKALSADPTRGETTWAHSRLRHPVLNAVGRNVKQSYSNVNVLSILCFHTSKYTNEAFANVYLPENVRLVAQFVKQLSKQNRSELMDSATPVVCNGKVLAGLWVSILVPQKL